MLKSAEYNEKTISQAIKTKWAGKTVYFAEKVDSTNSWIKRLSKEGAEHGTLAVAEFQSAGRGRFDRKWEAPEGSSIMMTILLRPEFEPQYASMLTLVMGLAVAQAVDELGFKVSIKWPNDVVLSRKKICGILTEMGTNGTKIGYVLIGVGINVNLREFPEEMQDKATSLVMESGQEYDRNQIIGLVMKHFEEDYERFIQTCDFENLLEEYHRILANLNQPVRVLNGADSFEGVSRGIDTKGELLITIMSSLAQEESRSISENTRWGMRKAFQNGKVFVPFRHFLGYDRGANGELQVNLEQAKTVQMIYRMFLEGYSFYGIAAELTKRGISTPYGLQVWNGRTVKNILQNEKYRGDALLQKRYSRDFLDREMRKNEGEVPQYYIVGNHEAIIDTEMFQRVQEELKRREARYGK